MERLSVIALVLSLLWEDCVLGRNIFIKDGDEQTVFGDLYLLNSGTSHSQRLKRRHVESPQKDIRTLRLHLKSVDKVIDMDLQVGSVWDSSSEVLLRHGEEVKTFIPKIGPNCHFSGRIKTGHGYASFSFCNGVSGIIQTDKENYAIEQATNDPNDATSNDIDADLPSVLVRITRDDDAQYTSMENDNIEETEEVKDTVLDDENYDTTETKISSEETTNPYIGIQSLSGQRKATVELGVYINSNYLNVLKQDKIKDAMLIVEWVVKRWNIIRELFKNTTLVGKDIDIKVRQVEIWSKDPAYFGPPGTKHTIYSRYTSFSAKSPIGGADQKILYTWEDNDRERGITYKGGMCDGLHKCSIVMPRRSSVSIEIHEFGHSLGLDHQEDMPNCKFPFGFMAAKPGFRIEFKSCYKPELLKAFANYDPPCLYKRNINKGQVSLYDGKKLVPAHTLISSYLD